MWAYTFKFLPSIGAAGLLAIHASLQVTDAITG
jgi:hypothetical protein